MQGAVRKFELFKNSNNTSGPYRVKLKEHLDFLKKLFFKWVSHALNLSPDLFHSH